MNLTATREFSEKSDPAPTGTLIQMPPADVATDHLVNVMSSTSSAAADSVKRYSRFSQGESSTSASTVATILTMSPSESLSESLVTVATTVPSSTKENINANFAKTKCVMQPHQGQNPTVERNTHKRSDEELEVIGNSLVDKNTGKSSTQAITDELLDALADNLESSLVQNDLLSHPQVAPLHNPIAYTVQNCVHGGIQNVIRPKQPNVAGPSEAEASKPKSIFAKLRKSSKGFPFFGRQVSAGQPSTVVANGGAPDARMAELRQNGHVRSRSDGVSNLERKSNLDVQPVSTEVRLVSGAAIVRPASLSLGGGDGGSLQQMELLQSSGRAVPVRQKARSHVDLSPASPLLQTSSVSDVNVSLRIQRPASLALCGGHQYSTERIDQRQQNGVVRRNAANSDQTSVSLRMLDEETGHSADTDVRR